MKRKEEYFILFLELLTDTIHKEMEARKRKGKWVELVSRGLEGEHKVAFTVNVSIKLQTAEQPQLRPGGGSRVRRSGKQSTCCEQQKKTGSSVVVALGSARFDCVFEWVSSCWKC